MGFDERGELMGHISIGIELVNSLWRKLQTSEGAGGWNGMTPASEDVRLHLLHLIGAHHGEPQFGSPVSPKTPEAMALNYIDNLDARLEMFAAGYLVAKPIAERIFDRVRPLPGNLVKPLEKFAASNGGAPGAPRAANCFRRRTVIPSREDGEGSHSRALVIRRRRAWTREGVSG